MLHTNDPLPDMTAAYQEVQEKKNEDKKEDKKERWQDDDGDGKWYEKSDVDGKISKREKEEKKAMKKEDATYGYDKKGNSLNPKDKKKAKKEEVDAPDGEQLDEISPDLALKASKKADVERGKKAAAGDREGAAKKSAQASRLYKAQAKKRLNREDTEIIDDLVESGLFSDEEIKSILNLEEE